MELLTNPDVRYVQHDNKAARFLPRLQKSRVVTFHGSDMSCTKRSPTYIPLHFQPQDKSLATGFFEKRSHGLQRTLSSTQAVR